MPAALPVADLPPGFVRFDNLGTPAIVRCELIGAVYVANDNPVTTRIALRGLRSRRGRSLNLHVTETPEDVAAAIALAVQS